MPELPEVETLKQGLKKYLVGHKIENVELLSPRVFGGDKEHVLHALIQDVRRFGKGLVIDLSNGYSLAIHIKLTGQLIYTEPNGPKETNGSKISKEKVGKVPNNFTRVIFHLDNRAFLYYNDIRMFGWIKVVKSDKIEEISFFKDLGPEFPLVKGSNNLTIEQFSTILSKSRLAIKPLIMDQKKMAGVGNIYANDGLYLAKISPKRPANSLSLKEAQTLYDSLLTVFKKGLEEGGASELTFVNALGEMGNYQNHSLVYGHKGEKCKRDGGIIKKEMLSGRGTYWCNTCQK